jgi:hypothetical protein
MSLREIDGHRKMDPESARLIQLQAQCLLNERSAPPPKRPLPAWIDIWLFPFSITGVMTMMSFAVMPFIRLYAGRRFWFVNTWPMLLACVLYLVWYFSQCALHSAQGKIRAPAISKNLRSFDDLEDVMLPVAVFIVCLGPACAMWFWKGHVDVLVLAALALEVFFLPMAVLRAMIYGEISALNPFVIIFSICRVVAPYTALVSAAAALAFFLYRLFIHAAQFGTQVMVIVFGVYAYLILAHLLGRIYWNNQALLDWDV